MTVLQEEWRAAYGGVIAADGAKLLDTRHGDARELARARIAVVGKRALVLLLQASTCPTCGAPMTGHVPG